MVLFCYYRMYFLYVHTWVVVCIVLGLAFCIYTYCEIEEIYSGRCTIASKSKRSSPESGSFFLFAKCPVS